MIDRILTRLSLYQTINDSRLSRILDILSWIPIFGVFFNLSTDVGRTCDRCGRTLITTAYFCLIVLLTAPLYLKYL